MAKKQTESRRLFLRRVEVFSGLEGRSLDSVAAVLKEESFPAGTILFTEGELGRAMFVLLEGEVEVLRLNRSGEPIRIVRLGPGECFGEMALIELGPRSASVVATKPVKVLSLNNLDLYKLFHEDNYAFVIVLQNISRLVSRRLREADARIAEFLSKPAKRGKRAKRA